MIVPKSYLIGVSLLLVGLFPGQSMAAAPIAPTAIERSSDQALLQQIKILLMEVVRLQALLQAQNERTVELVINPSPRQLVFFNRPFEASYRVRESTSRNNSTVRSIDQELFQLFVGIIGKERVLDQVGEWRVFRDDYADLGAFVELVAGTDDWVVGVNIEEYKTNNPSVRSSYAELMIHEYGHILFFSQEDFVREYTRQFWTAADKAHETAVTGSPAAKRFDRIEQYYEGATDRFVSAYATISLDEDMAETFVRFVSEPKPTGDSIREQKIRAFYTVPELVTVRAELRANLQKLGIEL